MFTGLIENIGLIKDISTRGNYLKINICPSPMFDNITIGESIAVSGPCLTVTSFDNNSFTVEASQETVQVTSIENFRIGGKVNLERALKADSRLGGHFVSGHIDAALKITRLKRIGLSFQVSVELPKKHAPFIVDKGSVSLNGVSLTVSGLDKTSFTVNLIPETQKTTTLAELKTGDKINVEFDLIGKYILRFVNQRNDDAKISIKSLREMGY